MSEKTLHDAVTEIIELEPGDDYEATVVLGEQYVRSHGKNRHKGNEVTVEVDVAESLYSWLFGLVEYPIADYRVDGGIGHEETLELSDEYTEAFATVAQMVDWEMSEVDRRLREPGNLRGVRRIRALIGI